MAGPMTACRQAANPFHDVTSMLCQSRQRKQERLGTAGPGLQTGAALAEREIFIPASARSSRLLQLLERRRDV